ncbi:MAG: PKD domain-containing protein [Saprospiraceae bacterium]|nr:PKD domain-containing protein [Saprospiraceae bacterium]
MMIMAFYSELNWMYGQSCNIDCPELLVNPDLIIEDGVTNGEEAYCDGNVPGWRGVDWTPHIIEEVPVCNFNITNPLTAITCLRSSGSGDFRETMVQENLNFSTDPLVEYQLRMQVRMLNCGSVGQYPEAFLDVRTAPPGHLLAHCIKVAPAWSIFGTNQIYEQLISSFNLQEINHCFTVTEPAGALWIRTHRPVILPPVDQNYSVLGIESVSLKCSTRALTDILISNTGNNYMFETTNVSEVSTFVTYHWDFGDPESGSLNTSNLAQPEHFYECPGIYRVCVNSIDNNGCCASLCEYVEIEEAEYDISFSYSDDCQTVAFLSSTSEAPVSYLWDFGDGVGTSTDAHPHYTYAQNGTYVVSLTVAFPCDVIKVDTLQIFVCCKESTCDLPFETIGILTSDCGNFVYLSSLLNNNTIPHTTSGNVKIVSDQKFSLIDNLIIDVPVRFRNTEWYCNPGTFISLAASMENISSHYSACTEMWQGIINNGYSLSFINNGSISDAEHAIWLRNNSRIWIENCTFKNNLRGIFSPTPSNVLKNIIFYPGTRISGNTFELNGQIKPPYEGQNLWQNRPIAGIDITDVAHFGVFNCTFKNLDWGIRTQGSKCVVSQSRFENTDGLRSVGIELENIIGQNLITNTNTFDNMDVGVVSYNNTMGSIDISGNNNFVCNRNIIATGIGINTSSGTDIVLNSNTFDIHRGYSIEVLNVNSLKFEVKSNTFTKRNDWNNQIQFVSLHPFKRGIVESNTVNVNGTVNNSFYPISLTDVRNLDFINNSIIGVHNNWDIIFQGSQRCLFTGNFINSNPYGFNIEMSSENTYCCNIFPQSSANFWGECYSNFRGNSLKYLNLMLGGKIGPQISAGNIWNEVGSSATIAFESDQTPGNALLNNFLTDPLQTGHQPQAIDPLSLATIWFQAIGLPMSCVATPDCGIPPYNVTDYPDDYIMPEDTIGIFPDPTGDPIAKKCESLKEYLTNLKAYNNINLNPFIHQSQWNAHMILLYWIDMYGKEFWESCLGNEFLYDEDIALWYEAEKQRSKIRRPSHQHYLNYRNIQTNLTAMLPAFNNESMVDFSIGVDDRDSILFEYLSMTQELKLYVDSVKSDSKVKSEIFLSQIGLLPVKYDFLAHRKQVWELEQKVYLTGLASVSNSDWNDLRNIAEMCPLENGQVVYEARTLLRLAEVNDFPSIEATCSVNEIRSKSKVDDQYPVLYPNPSSGLIYFDIPKLLSPSKLRIFNVNGITLLELDVASAKNVELDLSTYHPGIYFYEISGIGKSLGKGKILLIK